MGFMFSLFLFHTLQAYDEKTQTLTLSLFGISIKQYRAVAKHIIIMNNVTEIPSYAFSLWRIITVDLSDSVTSIGFKAFYHCSLLESIKFSNNLRTIEESAFETCCSLSNLTLPNSIISLDSNAFQRCELLNTITISKSVTYIGENVFSNCIKLQYIKISNENQNYSNYKDDGVIYSKDISSIICYPCGKSVNNYELPKSVLYIKSYAFNSCNEFKTFEISNSVLSIGSNSFSFVMNLENVLIGNNVQRIEDNAFEFCFSLKNVTIPKSVNYIGTNVFIHCDKIQFIKVDKNNLKYSNFENDDVLYDKRIKKLILYPVDNPRKTFVIPNSVIYIDDYSFNSCSNLINIIIPNSVTSIGKRAFMNCNHLETVEIGENVKTINESAFTGSYNLKNIQIPKSVTFIGEEAFQNTGLYFINVSLENEKYSNFKNDGVLYDKDITKLICYPIKKENEEFKIPNTVTSIGKYAFKYCLTLTKIIIGEKVNSIGDNAFFHCKNLQNISFYGEVEPKFGDSVFTRMKAKYVITTKNYNGTKFGPLNVIKELQVEEGNNDITNNCNKNNAVFAITMGCIAALTVIIVVTVLVIKYKNKRSKIPEESQLIQEGQMNSFTN